MNAKLAKELLRKPYTLDEIYKMIERQARHGTRLTGLDIGLLNLEVLDRLVEDGFTIIKEGYTHDGRYAATISWGDE